MKPFPLLLGSVSLALAAHLVAAAPAQSPAWSREYDGPNQGADSGYALVTGPAGEVYVAGRTAGSPGGVPPQPHTDALIQKYDAFGTLLWQRTVDLGGEEAAIRLAIDPATGALYAAGAVGGAAGVPKPWIAWRIDAQNGSVLWQRAYLGSGSIGGSARDLVVDAAGGVVLAGFVRIGTTQSDAAVVRYAADGTPTWEWNLAGAPAAFADVTSTAADPAGGVVITVREGTGTHSLRKIGAAGTQLWQVLSSDALGRARVDAASSVVHTRAPAGGAGSSIEKRDAGGNLVWSLPDAAVHAGGAATIALELASNGDVVAAGEGTLLARIGGGGTVSWTSALPSYEIGFGDGFFRRLALAANDDVLVLAKGFTAAVNATATVNRWSGGGVHQWGQRVRGLGGRDVEPYAIAASPHGGLAVVGTSTGASSSNENLMVASLREQSRRFCHGDGSAAACPCGNDIPAGLAGGCRDGNGISARLDDHGVASVSGDTLRLFASGVQAGGLAVVMQGSANAGAVPFQAGLLCLAGPLRRLYVQGAPSITLDVPRPGDPGVSARSAALGDVLSPGSRRAYQVFFRGGPGSPCAGTSGNLTNAVEVTWY